MVVKDKLGRRRYIAFEIDSERSIARRDLIATIRSAAKSNKLNTSMRPWLAKYSKNKGLLRCQHKYKNEAIRFLTAIHHIKAHPVIIRTTGTSGTIRCATRKYLKKPRKAEKNRSKITK